MRRTASSSSVLDGEKIISVARHASAPSCSVRRKTTSECATTTAASSTRIRRPSSFPHPMQHRKLSTTCQLFLLLRCIFLSTLFPSTSTFFAAASVYYTRHPEMTLTVEHFGVPGLNEEGSIGIVPSKCKKNCNFRGVCEAGTCYCQPGFSGKRCEKETLSKKGNYAMDEVGMVAVAVFLFFFLLTFTVLQYQEYSKKATERAMGYAV